MMSWSSHERCISARHRASNHRYGKGSVSCSGSVASVLPAASMIACCDAVAFQCFQCLLQDLGMHTCWAAEEVRQLVFRIYHCTSRLDGCRLTCADAWGECRSLRRQLVTVRSRLHVSLQHCDASIAAARTPPRAARVGREVRPGPLVAPQDAAYHARSGAGPRAMRAEARRTAPDARKARPSLRTERKKSKWGWYYHRTCNRLLFRQVGKLTLLWSSLSSHLASHVLPIRIVTLLILKLCMHLLLKWSKQSSCAHSCLALATAVTGADRSHRK